MTQIAVVGDKFSVWQTVRCYRLGSGWSNLEAGTILTVSDLDERKLGGATCFKVKTSRGEEVYLPEPIFATGKLEKVASDGGNK